MLSEKLKYALLEPDRTGRKQIIYLTGLLGSGKTTLGLILKDRVNGIFFPEFIDPVPNYFISVRSNSPVDQRINAQVWAINQHARKNDRINIMNDKVVVDRTWTDAVIYSMVFGSETLYSALREAEKYDWEHGLFVFLYARHDVIEERVRKRLSITKPEWKKEWKPFVYDLYEMGIQFWENYPVTAIDTSMLTIEETVSITEKRLATYFKA